MIRASENVRSPEEKEPQRVWNRAFVSVFIVNASLYLSQQMMNALVAKYADSLGASATVVGLVSSMFAVSALLWKVISGPASDAFNRKYILMGGMLLMALSYFGYSVSATIPVLMLSRLLQGTGQAFTTTCILALAADTLPIESFGSGIGFLSMAQAAAQAVGPTVGLSLSARVGFNKTFFIGAAIMLVAVVVATQIETNFQKTKKFHISVDRIMAKEAVLPAFIIFFLAMAFSVISSFLIIFAGEQGVQNIGYYFTVYAVTLLFTRPMIGRLTDRWGLTRVAIPALVCFASSFWLISCASSLWMFLLAGFVAAFGYGACQPAIQTLAMKCVPSDRRGAASSTNYIGTDLGNLVGPVLSGSLAEHFGYASMWRLMIVPMAVSLLIILLFRGRIEKIETDFRNTK